MLGRSDRADLGLVSIQPGYPPGMRCALLGQIKAGAEVSIQPGYPPGMRSVDPGEHCPVHGVSIQPGYPPGMRCRTCKCLILRANRPVLREPADRQGD